MIVLAFLAFGNYVVNASFSQTTIASGSFAATSLWVDSNANIFYVDGFSYKVKMFNSSSGATSTIIGTGVNGPSSGGPATSTSMCSPFGLAVSSTSDVMYVSGYMQIYRYNRSSDYVTVYAGSTTPGYSGNGGPATSAKLTISQGLWLTTDGTLYIAEAGNYVVRSISPTGIIDLVAGSNTKGSLGDGGPATSTNAQFDGVYGVYVDTNGVLFITDSNNAKIRYVQSGILNTFAGGGSSSASGQLATNTMLGSPYAVTGDTLGNIYMAELDSAKVRVIISPSGVVLDYVAKTGS